MVFQSHLVTCCLPLAKRSAGDGCGSPDGQGKVKDSDRLFLGCSEIWVKNDCVKCHT